MYVRPGPRVVEPGGVPAASDSMTATSAATLLNWAPCKQCDRRLLYRPRVDPKPVTQHTVALAPAAPGRQANMQASRRGLAQVGGSRQCRSVAPGSPTDRPPFGFPCPLQARGRLLRSKALSEAGYASIAGLDKVGVAAGAGVGAGSPWGQGWASQPQSNALQAPMSRMEPDQYINDRYQAIEDRLRVRARLSRAAAAAAAAAARP